MLKHQKDSKSRAYLAVVDKLNALRDRSFPNAHKISQRKDFHDKIHETLLDNIEVLLIKLNNKIFYTVLYAFHSLFSLVFCMQKSRLRIRKIVLL